MVKRNRRFRNKNSEEMEGNRMGDVLRIGRTLVRGTVLVLQVVCKLCSDTLERREKDGKKRRSRQFLDVFHRSNEF